MSEYDRAVETYVFRTGDTAHKIHRQKITQYKLTIRYIWCCRITFAQYLDCIQVCLTVVKFWLYWHKKCCTN